MTPAYSIAIDIDNVMLLGVLREKKNIDVGASNKK